MSRLFAAICLCLTPFAALANDQVTSFDLDNGMQVVVIEDHRAAVVVHMVWYRAGSADEPVGQSGVAHFLEHLMFNATENLEKGELSATVTANGGSDNAFTNYDYTGYYQRVAADRLDLMMGMEADRMVNLRLSPDDIETERNVILEERNQRTENNPNALMREQARAALFQNHHYAIPVIGWKHEMEQLGLEEAQTWYDTYYAPNNAILVVAGDVTPEEVRVLAEKHYGVIPANADLPERIRPEEPPHRAERRLIYTDPRVSQAYVTRSYLAPERDPGAQEDAAALVYLAELLGGSNFTSVLPIKLQFETQIAVYTGASYGGGALDDTSFGLVIVPSEGVGLQAAEDALDNAVAEFLAEGIDPERMETIRTQFRAGEIYARDNVEGIANRYGALLAQSLTVEDIQAWPDILQNVTAEQVIAIAETVLDRDHAVTTWVAATREEMQP